MEVARSRGDRITVGADVDGAAFGRVLAAAEALLSALVVLASPAALAQGTPDGETPANEGVCDELLGGTPGLYGLCVGFCEAQDCEATYDPATDEVTYDASCKPSSDKLLENYDKRAQAGDPPMLCVNVVEAECRCWTEAELDQVADGNTLFCGITPDGDAQMVGYDGETGGFEVAITTIHPKFGSVCQYLEATHGFPRFLSLDLDQLLTCIASLEAECVERSW